MNKAEEFLGTLGAKRGPPEKMATRPPSLKPQNWGTQLLGRERTAFRAGGGGKQEARRCHQNLGFVGRAGLTRPLSQAALRRPRGGSGAGLRSPPALPPPPPGAEALRLSESELRQQNTKTTEDSLLFILAGLFTAAKKNEQLQRTQPTVPTRKHRSEGGCLAEASSAVPRSPARTGGPEAARGLPGPEGEEG